jgi:hypothetical protein
MAKPIVKSLNTLRTVNPYLAECIDDLVMAHDNVSKQLATDPNGSEIVPPNIAMVQAQHLGNGLVDLAITDNAPISRAINYHVEYDSTPNFTNPRGATLGPWRTGTIFLPNGTWFFRAYSQYPAGGGPNTPVIAPGSLVINVKDGAAGPLFASQGSGTGKPQQGGGQGSGKLIQRSSN